MPILIFWWCKVHDGIGGLPHLTEFWIFLGHPFSLKNKSCWKFSVFENIMSTIFASPCLPSLA